eukprot:11032515-Karenia_brevis.AAC.1
MKHGLGQPYQSRSIDSAGARFSDTRNYRDSCDEDGRQDNPVVASKPVIATGIAQIVHSDESGLTRDGDKSRPN